MTLKELNQRIQQSEDDFDNGRFISARDLSKKFSKIDVSKDRSVDWWDELTEEEKQAIDRGLQQSENGEGISHEEVMKRIKLKNKNVT